MPTTAVQVPAKVDVTKQKKRDVVTVAAEGLDPVAGNERFTVKLGIVDAKLIAPAALASFVDPSLLLLSSFRDEIRDSSNEHAKATCQRDSISKGEREREKNKEAEQKANQDGGIRSIVFIQTRISH